MKRHKAVTKNKLEANRKNSKRSTGPRSQRGKNIAKFNAVTLGLCAKHVVIEICDGDGAKGVRMATRNVYKTTTIAHAKAAASKARSAKKKASRKAVSGKAGHAKA
ncbi:MAG TPA: hypothetical protein VIX37_11600 [Candidatus Sulfotelmatobacter sp.]